MSGTRHPIRFVIEAEKAKIIAERMEYIWNSDSSLDPFAADM